MPSLSDSTDRLAQHVKSIYYTASSTAVDQPTAFTRAVLKTALGDLIRDIDPAELGLFTLVHPTAPGGEKEKDTVTRVEFPGATPLRKPPAGRREEVAKREKAPEPEVYARAALKYLDRYQSIRPMPRARSQVVALLEELDELRGSIKSLNETFNAIPSEASLPKSPKSAVVAEEKKIKSLQDKINDLKHRKDDFSKPPDQRRKPKPPPSKPLIRAPSKAKPQPQESPRVTSPDAETSQEELFWGTPGAPARVLNFDSDNLLEVQPEMSDTSLMSPTPPSSMPVMRSRPEEPGDKPAIVDEETEGAENMTARLVDEDDEDEGDATVVLTKAPDATVAEASSEVAPPSAIDESMIVVAPPTPRRPRSDIETPSKPRNGKPRVKVTPEMEKIVAKMWATMGEVIMPGHPYDVTGNSTRRPPRARETISHLQSLAAQEPAPSSPSSTSLSSLAVLPPPKDQASTQQILTAHLLLTLLAAPGPMPLQTLKEKLAPAAEGVVGQGQAATRTLFSCVAKKLVKIDRGGGAQMVMFDV